ncbi:MAG: methyltransferase domain-containing protein [Alistipes sp.]|nr:methyltransferase domain-containing protein [Alistipes sp.]
MKRFIKFILNALPRPLLQRAASFGVPLLGLFYIGRGRECPVCGCRRRKFLPYGYVIPREDALCPRCLSLERHRLLWLWLERETDIAKGDKRLLHVAPEVSLMRRLKRIYAGNDDMYVTADLESPLAKMHFDIQNIPLEEGFADIVICNHIMEHVADDRRAMREIHRVMRTGGWGIILSPVELSRAETFEDDTISDPAERTRIFGQYDHRRIYGRDYTDRLREAGFEAEAIDYAATFTPEERTKYALSDERIYLVRKI